MTEAGSTIGIGGGGNPGVSPVIQEGDIEVPAVQFRILGDGKQDYAGSGAHPRGVSKTDRFQQDL